MVVVGLERCGADLPETRVRRGAVLRSVPDHQVRAEAAVWTGEGFMLEQRAADNRLTRGGFPGQQFLLDLDQQRFELGGLHDALALASGDVQVQTVEPERVR